MAPHRRTDPPDTYEFKRAVCALRAGLAEGMEVDEQWWTGRVDVRDGQTLRTYFMLHSENALDFCARICRTEPRCEIAVLAHFAGVTHRTSGARAHARD
jgi:hypothetical protein